MDRSFRVRRAPAHSSSKGARGRREYHGLLLRPLYASCALRSSTGESWCSAWLSGPEPTSGGSWDNLGSGRFSRLTGMRGEQPPCWISAVPCYVCSRSGVPVDGTGAGELLGALAARNKSLWAGLPPELHSGPVSVVRGAWSVARGPLDAHTLRRRLWSRVRVLPQWHQWRSPQQSSVPECGH